MDKATIPKIQPSAAQKELIAELRELVKSSARDEYELSDLFLSRYLTSKHWNLSLAADLYVKSMEWRNNTKPEQILETLPVKEKKMFDHFTEYWPVSLHHSTKDGWPLNFVSIGKTDPAGINEKTEADFRINFYTYVFEAMEQKRRKAEKDHNSEETAGGLLVLDTADLGWDHFGNTATLLLKEAGTIGKLHYPEAVSKVLIINTPRLFNMMWTVIKQSISADSLAKITILGEDYLPTLLEYANQDQIPSNLGGTAPAMPVGGQYYNPGEAQGKRVEKWDTATVPRSGVFEIPVQIKERAFIVWEFQTEDLDVGFGVFYQPEGGEKEENLPSKRYESDKEVIRDLIEARRPGTYILQWDNTFSWTKRKFLNYRYKVLEVNTNK